MGNQASMVNSMADKLFLPADLVLDGHAPSMEKSSVSRSYNQGRAGGTSPDRAGHVDSGTPPQPQPSVLTRPTSSGSMRFKLKYGSTGSSASSLRAGASPSASLTSFTASSPFASSGPSSAAPHGGMGILAFEVAPAMQRALELWEQLDPANISRLRLLLQTEGIVKLVRSEDVLPWQLVGLEIQRDLSVLRSIVIALGKRGSDPRLHTLDGRFKGLDPDTSPVQDPATRPLDGCNTSNSSTSSSSSGSGSSSGTGSSSSAVGTSLGAGSSSPGTASLEASAGPTSTVHTGAAFPSSEAGSEAVSVSTDDASSKGSDPSSAVSTPTSADPPPAPPSDTAPARPTPPPPPSDTAPTPPTPAPPSDTAPTHPTPAPPSDTAPARPAPASQPLTAPSPSRLPSILIPKANTGCPPAAAQTVGSPERIYPQSFLPKEEGFLLRYLEDMLAATSTLHLEMSTLDNLLPSSHPLRLSRMLRDLPSRSAAAAGGAPLPPQAAAAAPTGYIANTFAQERIAAQTKAVQRLQKESLWSESFDKCIVLLAAAVIVLTRKFQSIFGAQPPVPVSKLSNTLWAAGLSLHYAHTVVMVDKIVTRPTMLLRVQRDELYQRLPLRVRRGLRTRLKGKHRPFDLEAAVEIRHAMQDMLAWLMPLATSTISWQTEHSYGCHLSRRTAARTLQVQTLHFADKDLFETLLVELLAGVSYFARPPGLTGLQPQEEASWKAWQSSGGDPRIARSEPSKGGQAGGPTRSATRAGAGAVGEGGKGTAGGPGGQAPMSISTLWGDGMRKDGLSQALSAFGAAAKASYTSAFFGDKSSSTGTAGGGGTRHPGRPLGTGRKPSPTRGRPQSQAQALLRQASF